MTREYAWAAGFYEGEGSIACAGHSLILSIAQVNREPLERFRHIFGVGHIRRAPDGRITFLRIYGRQAQRVVMALWPDLSTRLRDQVLRALVRYASRRVNDPRRCRRGHVAPNRYRGECRQCREARRKGPRGPLPPRPTAFAARVGVREYAPAVQT